MFKPFSAACALLAAACATPQPAAMGAPAEDVIAVRSLTSEDFSDLRALLPALQGVRIVQLGENSHGAGEFFDLKARLVRFLHQEAGFDVLILESSIYQCARIDAAMAESAADTETLLTGCAFGVWHSREVLDLFDYMRTSREGPSPLRLAGYDVQPIGWNKRGRPAFLSGIIARLDPDYAAAVAALDQEVIDAYDQGGSARRAHYRAHRERLVAAYADLQDWFASHAAPLTAAGAAAGDIVTARQTAWSVLQYLRQQTAPDMIAYAEARDYGMAVNARALVEDMFPDSRVIIWAHNVHVRHNNESLDPGQAEFIRARGAGSWLRDWYGEELFTLGVYARSGEMTDNARDVAAVTPSTAGALESWPIPVGAPAVIHLPPRFPDPRWDGPVTAKYSGLHDIEMVLRDQYDAVAVIDQVSPPDYFY